jgi:hypothetical protein
MVFNHFVNLLGQMQARSASLNWEDLFEEEEIKKVIVHMANEKAPGPNGFIGLFYKKCWEIIWSDLLAALGAFHSLRTRKLELINEANVVLPPKTPQAADIIIVDQSALSTVWQK